jgi:DNA-binding transcriptional LysR family regulator
LSASDGFDLALRIATLEDSSLLARRLRAVRILLVASPGYLDAHGRPTHPAQLRDHVAMAYAGGGPRGVWRFTHALFGEGTVTPSVRLGSDNADMLNPALLAGQGPALQPEFLVWREVRSGALEIAMPEWTVEPLALHLIMPPSPLRPLRVQVVIDHFARALAAAPWAR